MALSGNDGVKLSFAHIENLSSGHLMIADSLGTINLSPLFAEQGDSLRISHIGYKLELYKVDYRSDTVLLLLQGVSTTFSEVATRVLPHTAKFKLRNANKTAMPFEPGDILAIRLHLKGNTVNIHSIQLSSRGGYDSLKFRISLQREINYEQHLLLGKQVLIEGAKVNLTELNLRSNSDSGFYYLLIEPYAYVNNRLVSYRLNGREPKNDTEIEKVLIRGRLIWSDTIYTTQWFHHPFWVPSIKMEYAYD